MDVRCDTCSTVYELDEARVGVDGLLVKCSKCGHEFRAMPAPQGAAPSKATDEWVVRQPSGNTFRFRELTTLQRWIVERKVTRDDEISRTGKKWERLGNIPELATFFQVVEDRQAVVLPPLPTQPAAPALPLGPPGQVHGAAWEHPNPPLAHGVSTARYGLEEAQAIDRRARDADDHDEIVRAALGKSRRRTWVWLTLLLLAVAGGGLYAAQPELLAKLYREAFERVPEEALRELNAAYEVLRVDDAASLTAAAAGFERALQLAPDYAAAKAGLAEALAARAEDLAAEASALTAAQAKLPAPDAEGQRRALELSKSSAELLARAEVMMQDAQRLEPKTLASHRAAAEVYRIAGKAALVESAAQQARQVAPDDTRLNYVLGAAAAADPSAMERAIRYLDIALEADARQNRARFVLARLYAGAGQKDKALDHAKRILASAPTHERAKALVTELEAPPPAPAEPAPVPEPPPAPEAPVTPEVKAPKPATFEQLLAQADRLRQSDRATLALKTYERAVEMNPDDAEGHTGMGWSYIDLENANAAIASFRRALEIAPKFSEAHLGMAEAFRMKGMKRDAIKHYRAYLDILPDGPEAPVAKRMLEQLAN